MKYKLFLITLFLNCTICLSQSELAKKGTITLADNQKIAFNNLRLVDGKFVFADVASGSEKELAMSEIKYVEDDSHSRIFTNKSVVDKTKEADDKALAEETERRKKIFEEAKLKEEANKPQPLNLYPNGIYKTKEDFIKGIPSSTNSVIPRKFNSPQNSGLGQIDDNCFFYYPVTDVKVKNVFAISYNGYLYFQVSAILENRNKTDRAQTNDHPNGFSRVLTAGKNYYYLEVYLVNAWAQGLAYNAGAGGAMMAQSMFNTKGIVWDIKNEEFNIFKNCNDYNDFIKDKYPEGVQECKKQQPDIVQVRKSIERIK